MGTVLLFNTRAASDQAVRLHSASCPVVSAARRSKGVVRVVDRDIDWQIADFVGRGWPVRACRCVKLEEQRERDGIVSPLDAAASAGNSDRDHRQSELA